MKIIIDSLSDIPKLPEWAIKDYPLTYKAENILKRYANYAGTGKFNLCLAEMAEKTLYSIEDGIVSAKQIESLDKGRRGPAASSSGVSHTNACLFILDAILGEQILEKVGWE